MVRHLHLRRSLSESEEPWLESLSESNSRESLSERGGREPRGEPPAPDIAAVEQSGCL